jgi:hypothetical protein
MVVMAVIVAMIVAMFVMGFRSMGMVVGTMRIVVMLDGVTTGTARMRPRQRDDARQDGAEQRQENDGLNHMLVPLRMISAQTRFAFVATENRFALFRIMRCPSPSSD